MPKSWTPEMHERLLQCALDGGMLDNGKLADLWKLKYPGDETTASAIRQHLNKMRSKHSNGTTGSAKKGSTPANKATTRKPAAPKTPTSSMKRKKDAMSDEDDSEDERGMNGGTPIKVPTRERSSRSKTPKKSYAELDAGDEDLNADDAEEAITIKDEDGDAFAGMNGAADHGDFDAMSETSAFDPGAEFN